MQNQNQNQSYPLSYIISYIIKEAGKRESIYIELEHEKKRKRPGGLPLHLLLSYDIYSRLAPAKVNDARHIS